MFASVVDRDALLFSTGSSLAGALTDLKARHDPAARWLLLR